MPIITYDTCVFISKEPSSFPKGFRMTAVVLQELTAGSPDDAAVREFEVARRNFEKAGILLVPTGEDWWFAGKILNSMLRGLKNTNKGKIPRLGADEKQRIIRDVLIARIAKRAGAVVVTDNLRDFARIQQYCSVKILSTDDHFA